MTTATSFKPLSEFEIKSLRLALQGNADGTGGLTMGSDTSFERSTHQPVEEEATDAEVISAIKSMPCHYADDPALYGFSLLQGLYQVFRMSRYTGVSCARVELGKISFIVRDPSDAVGLVSTCYA